MKQNSTPEANPQAVTLSFLLTKNTLHCIEINGDIEALTGYLAQDLLTKNPCFKDLFHHEDHDVYHEIFSHSPQSEFASLTYRIIQKSGQAKIIRGSYEKQPRSASDETRILLSLQDPISLRQDVVSDTLLTNFAAMMENSEDYIYFKDRNHVFTGASQTLVEITNSTKHWTELIGTTDYSVFPQEYADIYFTLEKKVFSGLLPVAQEIQPTLDKHGNKGWVDNRKYPIKDKDGNITGLFGIARDITKLVTAEELARQAQLSSAILNSIEDVVVTCDAEGKITLINRASCDCYSLKEIPVHINELSKFVMIYEDSSPTPLAIDQRPLQRALRGETLRNVEMRFEYHDGESKYLIVNGKPLINAEGSNIGAIISLHDITAQKILENEAVERRNEMEALIKRQVAVQTAGAIAHELNQPLFAIASYSEAALMMLKDKNIDQEKIIQTLQKIVAQAHRAGQSIRELLNTLSMHTFSTEAFDLNKEILDILTLAKTESDLQFHFQHWPEENLPLVLANRIHVQKVLLNLLHNSIEAMQGAGVPLPSIIVTVRTINDGSVAQVTIKDNGPGFKPESIKRLFEPFFTTKPGGVGIGLVISRSLIEANGGQLWVDPEERPGATFHLTLPFAP